MYFMELMRENGEGAKRFLKRAKSRELLAHIDAHEKARRMPFIDYDPPMRWVEACLIESYAFSGIIARGAEIMREIDHIEKPWATRPEAIDWEAETLWDTARACYLLLYGEDGDAAFREAEDEEKAQTLFRIVSYAVVAWEHAFDRAQAEVEDDERMQAAAEPGFALSKEERLARIRGRMRP